MLLSLQYQLLCQNSTVNAAPRLAPKATPIEIPNRTGLLILPDLFHLPVVIPYLLKRTCRVTRLKFIFINEITIVEFLFWFNQLSYLILIYIHQ